MRTTRALMALTLALTVLLTACGNDDTETTNEPLSSTEHNDADVAFASEMIQHHAQALTMVDLTLERPLSPEVQALAEQIRAAQGPEIETMADWLTEWGEDVPETMRDHSNAEQDMGDMGDLGDMPGMMSGDQMAALEESGDAEFEALWLEMMVEHHEGAVQMAEAERSEGRYQPAVDLAGEIVSSQTDEIATMRDLLS